MKKITAIVKPFKLEEVVEALSEKGIVGITMKEVQGSGRQNGHTELYRGAEYAVEFNPKIQLELVVQDEETDMIVALIKESAYTGKTGDGKVFIASVTQAVRIRTGELGAEAL
jgi:nitrogen regulatory protein PII